MARTFFALAACALLSAPPPAQREQVVFREVFPCGQRIDRELEAHSLVTRWLAEG